jgi:hypothetical protein
MRLLSVIHKPYWEVARSISYKLCIVFNVIILNNEMTKQVNHNHKSEQKQSNDITIKMHMDCMNHYATKALKGCVRLMKTM